MQNRSEISLMDLPNEILLQIMRYLDATDFRLSRTNSRIYQLFNSENNNKHWNRTAKQVFGKQISNNVKLWPKYFCFLNYKKRWPDQNIARLYRFIRMGDEVSARMLDINKNYIINIIVWAHVRGLKALLYYIYHAILKQITNDEAFDYGHTKLHLAVYCFQSCEVVEALLLNGYLVDELNNAGYSALHIAASSGQAKTVSLLIRYQANIYLSTKNNETVLSRAISHGHGDCVDLLVNAGNNFNLLDSKGNTSFSLAFNEAKIKDLLNDNFCQIVKENNIDMSLAIHQNIFLLCCQNGYSNIVAAMVDKNINFSFTINASASIIRRNCEKLHLKNEMGSLLKVNFDGWYQEKLPGFTALDLAIIFNHKKVVALLVAKMNQDDLRNLLTQPHLNGEATTLQLATLMNFYDIIHEVSCDRTRSMFLTNVYPN